MVPSCRSLSWSSCRAEGGSASDAATLIRELAATGERDSLDAASLAASSVAQAAMHGSMGLKPRLGPEAVRSVKEAVAEALATAERLRSRHRGELRAILEQLEDLD